MFTALSPSLPTVPQSPSSATATAMTEASSAATVDMQMTQSLPWHTLG